MPHVPHTLEGANPEDVRGTDKPHLAALVQAAPPQWLALPPGSTLAIVMDIKDTLTGKGIVPFVLTSVERRKLGVRCACGQPSCTRRGVFEVKWTGHHPAIEKSVATGGK